MSHKVFLVPKQNATEKMKLFFEKPGKYSLIDSNHVGIVDFVSLYITLLLMENKLLYKLFPILQPLSRH